METLNSIHPFQSLGQGQGLGQGPAGVATSNGEEVSPFPGFLELLKGLSRRSKGSPKTEHEQEDIPFSPPSPLAALTAPLAPPIRGEGEAVKKGKTNEYQRVLENLLQVENGKTYKKPQKLPKLQKTPPQALALNFNPNNHISDGYHQILSQRGEKGTSIPLSSPPSSPPSSQPDMKTGEGMENRDHQWRLVEHGVEGQEFRSVQNIQKVLDLSGLKNTHSNGIELINILSDYIQKNSLGNREMLDLTVKHDELGTFKIHVAWEKGHEQIEVKILTESQRGHDFFLENESGLMKRLERAGMNVGEVKIFSPEGSKGHHVSDYDRDRNQNHLEDNNNKGESSSQNNPRHRDSQRRRELWNNVLQRSEV